MADITLLDGGMGQELVARSGDEPTPLWATRVMLDHPHLVRAIHDDYFAAGATVATTNTYAIHHDRLQPFGLDHLFADLHARALAEATGRGAVTVVGGGDSAAAVAQVGALGAQRPAEAVVPPHLEVQAGQHRRRRQFRRADADQGDAIRGDAIWGDAI